MIEKLNKFDLKISETLKLKTFESRDGFVLLENAEFEEIESYFTNFPIYRNLVAILTDENSNYWCINVNGPLKGMICYLSHDEPNLEPKFKNISSFLKAIDENPEAYDFNDLEETSFDFPNSKNETEFSERKEIIEKLFSEFNSENDEDIRQQIAFSIIALTSKEEIEDNIYPFLDNEDMYVQERAIQILGFHKYKPAKEKLIELKKTAMYNGQTAVGIALKKINEN
ncbi:HEAT repeat domain-containing protein [Flavobacterium sp. K77]|uniref:HEAT repeat domain-containing protein n=1 Tax=Flavobacterium sp. K77 TaxID=2910676 RepID=UPI001F40EC43|nr:HEAT repeat domain-containing protein [Flavobacterium sp. K77]MCF6142396.1 HEAT repeat domain-containing protein [Flavobacterium sp. K77]